MVEESGREDKAGLGIKTEKDFVSCKFVLECFQGFRRHEWTMSTTKPVSKAFSRRQFLATTALAVAAPTILSSCATGSGRKPAASGKITMGMIGCGWQGGSNMGAFLRHANCQVMAVCDLDQNHLNEAVKIGRASCRERV